MKSRVYIAPGRVIPVCRDGEAHSRKPYSATDRPVYGIQFHL